MSFNTPNTPPHETAAHPTSFHNWSPDAPAITSTPITPPLPSEPFPTDPSPRGSHRSRKTKSPGHIARPPNAFILFRSDFWRREKAKATGPIERDHRDISRIAGICWNELSPEEKGVWMRRAEELRLEHQQKFPEYKLKPAPRRPRVVKEKSGYLIAKEERCKQLAEKVMAENDEAGDVDTVSLAEKLADLDFFASNYAHWAETQQPTPSPTPSPVSPHAPFFASSWASGEASGGPAGSATLDPAFGYVWGSSDTSFEDDADASTHFNGFINQANFSAHQASLSLDMVPSLPHPNLSWPAYTNDPTLATTSLDSTAPLPYAQLEQWSPMIPSVAPSYAYNFSNGFASSDEGDASDGLEEQFQGFGMGSPLL